MTTKTYQNTYLKFKDIFPHHKYKKMLHSFEKLLSEHKKITKSLSLKKNSTSIKVLPGVFNPVYGDSDFLAQESLKLISINSIILDMGTGTGIVAIKNATKARKVIAVDINPKAVECARTNVELNGLQDKIEVRKSNIFSNISEKFDFILYNPPFRFLPDKDFLEQALTDYYYRSLTKFFRESPLHLNKTGKIIMVFGDIGDIEYLKYLARENHFKISERGKIPTIGYIGNYYYLFVFSL